MERLESRCRTWVRYLITLGVLSAGRLAGQGAAPADRLDVGVRFCGFGGDREVLTGLAAWWPNLEYCRAYDAGQVAGMKALGEEARGLGIRYTVQACAPAFPAGYLETHGNWAVDFLGRHPADLGFSHPQADYCHPATVAALRRNLEVALGEAGAKAFTMVDFVWPYIGGRWGYSEADLAAYRAALQEADGGLEVHDGGGVRTLTFWDYLEELSGVRFRPADLGYASWAEYTPVRPPDLGAQPSPEKRRNGFVFTALYHYCWLRYAQEGGRQARSLGGDLQASLNPENCSNGGDLLAWGRLTATGEPWLEEWGSPWIAMAGYHNLPYFARAYRKVGKRLGLIGETGAAGGHPDSGFGPARPHYWDPDSNYAITWALGAAAAFNDREEDYIWASWAETVDPESPQRDLWRGYIRGMDGFRQYAVDGARRPPCAVLSIVNRSVLHETESTDYSTGQAYSLAPALLDLHTDYLQGGFPLDADMLNEARVVLFSPWDYPRPFAARLQAWLAAAPGRVLVTHGFVPARPCNGMDTGPVHRLDDAAAAATLGLTGLRETEWREGTVNPVAPAWQGLFPMAAGTRLALPRPLLQCDGVPLLTLDGHPLVTEVSVPGGGRIVYLNFVAPERYQAGEPASDLLRACLQTILSEAQVQPQAEGSVKWACSRYDLEGGSAYLLLDRAACNQPRMTVETPSLAPAEKLALRLQPSATYLVYDGLEGTRSLRQTDAAGRLAVTLDGKNLRLLYVLPAPAVPCLVWTDGERLDGAPRTALPARLYVHRPGKLVVGGLPPGATVWIDGKASAMSSDAASRTALVQLEAGERQVQVR
jgi:hypothetical protein